MTQPPDEPVWKALANTTRREILDLLREGPRTTGEIADAFPDLTRFAVMQHLGVLAEADLVVARRVGRQRYNYLNSVPIQSIVERWITPYMQPWTEALVALRAELEAEATRSSKSTGGTSASTRANRKRS